MRPQKSMPTLSLPPDVVGAIFQFLKPAHVLDAAPTAKAWAEAGANLIFNYQGERLRGNLEQLTSTFGEDVPMYPCDVSSDQEIDAFFERVRSHTDRVDLLLHAVAFAPKEALEGDFLSTTREAFAASHDISAYSLVALSQRAAPLMTAGGSIIAMSYYGAEKVVPHYNVMGVAKASLEASTRYLARDLGERQIRANCISAGPVQTLAARGAVEWAEEMDEDLDAVVVASTSPARRRKNKSKSPSRR